MNGTEKTSFRYGSWFLKLAKRLFFRRGFLALLLLIPALGALMFFAAKEDSGITTVLLVVEDENDELFHLVIPRVHLPTIKSGNTTRFWRGYYFFGMAYEHSLIPI